MGSWGGELKCWKGRMQMGAGYVGLGRSIGAYLSCPGLESQRGLWQHWASQPSVGRNVCGEQEEGEHSLTLLSFDPWLLFFAKLTAGFFLTTPG